MSERHEHHDPEPHWARALHDKLDRALILLERLHHMSGSLGDQLNAGLTNLGTVLDTISSDVSLIATEVGSLVAGMTPGSTVTQAMVDQATSLAARAQSIDDALKAIEQQGSVATPGTAAAAFKNT